MNISILKTVRFSHIVAGAAVFATLGGTAYAGATIGSAQLRDNSVRSVDIKNRTLKTEDISPEAKRDLKNQWKIEGTAVAVPGGAFGTAEIMCDFQNGYFAAGGGGYSYYDGKGYLTGSSVVYGTGNFANMPVGWKVEMQNLQGTTNYIIIRAQCVRG